MDLGGLAIAVVGVLGTLSSPVITQRLSQRAKQEEAELRGAQLAEDSAREWQRALYEQKRSCYISMTATSRRYRIELMNYLYAAVKGQVDTSARDSLRTAREAYIASIAETHVTATLSVLEALEPVTTNLSWAFRVVKLVEEGNPGDGWQFEDVEAFLVKLWDQWVVLRQVMRADLGVED
jgi:hypothetical protein